MDGSVVVLQKYKSDLASRERTMKALQQDKLRAEENMSKETAERLAITVKHNLLEVGRVGSDGMGRHVPRCGASSLARAPRLDGMGP
jgi:hypothetical protein